MAASQDAPMFCGNLQDSGVYEAVGVPKLSGLKWKYHTAGMVRYGECVCCMRNRVRRVFYKDLQI